MKPFIALFALSLVGCATANKQTQERRPSNSCLEAEYDVTDGKEEVHGSTIVETKRGFLSAWFAGGEGQSKAVIQGAWWDGKEWSKAFVLADGIENGVDHPVWNPVLFINDDGHIELNYKVGPSPFDWWGRSRVSKDDGKTWSESISISNDPKVFGPIRAKPLKLQNGSWIAGSSTEIKQNGKEIIDIHLETREAGGSGWNYDPSFSKDPGNFKVIQPVIIEYSNGKLQLLARSKRKVLIESWSDDAGKTWSPLAATSTQNPGSAVDVLFHQKTKMALLAYNPGNLGRGKLEVASSADGKKWKKECTLKSGMVWNEYSYPAIIEDSQGRVHVTYTLDRRRIKHVILDY